MSPSPHRTEKGGENEKSSSTKNYQQLCVTRDYGLMLLSVDVLVSLSGLPNFTSCVIARVLPSLILESFWFQKV